MEPSNFKIRDVGENMADSGRRVRAPSFSHAALGIALSLRARHAQSDSLCCHWEVALIRWYGKDIYYSMNIHVSDCISKSLAEKEVHSDHSE